jgi:hypothetical protein
MKEELKGIFGLTFDQSLGLCWILMLAAFGCLLLDQVIRMIRELFK